jgi:membrane fusion protein (multidrug efflux system)
MEKKMLKSRLQTGVGVLLMTLIIAACEDVSAPPAVEFRIPVEVAEVASDNVEDLIVTTGTLRTRASVSLNIETLGLLEVGLDADGKRLTEGSAVRANQLIARTIGEDTRLASRLAATRQSLEAARSELERREQLLKQNMAADEEVARLRANYQNALHEYQTSLRTTEKAKIITPIDGVILQLARNAAGQAIADGQKVNQGLEIARIAPLDTLIADVDLVGPELARIKPGQPVRVRHYAYEDQNISGTVLRLSPTMDSTTRTFRVEVEVDNNEGLLKPGMFIQAAIIVEEHQNVPVVPRDAVTQRAGRSVVFVIDGQRAKRQTVSLGLGSDELVEVTSGLQAGDRIVVRGLETLTDGTSVRELSL